MECPDDDCSDDHDDDDDDDDDEVVGGWSPDEAYLRPAPRPSPHFSNADYTILRILYTVYCIVYSVCIL